MADKLLTDICFINSHFSNLMQMNVAVRHGQNIGVAVMVWARGRGYKYIAAYSWLKVC